MMLKKYKNKLPLKHKLCRLLWNIAWLTLFRTTPKWCFKGWRVFLLKLFGASIGKGCAIHSTCHIWAPWNMQVGDYVCLSSDVDFYSVERISIGDRVTVSQRSFLCCASHDITSPAMELTYKPITIESQAWIAAQAFIGPGVTIGEGAVVGACAVVTKDVAPWTVVAGNPAREVKKRVIQETGDGATGDG